MEVVELPGFTNGTYRLFHYTGTLIPEPSSIATLMAGIFTLLYVEGVTRHTRR
jgi:hypothetical protein